MKSVNKIIYFGLESFSIKKKNQHLICYQHRGPQNTNTWNSKQYLLLNVFIFKAALIHCMSFEIQNLKLLFSIFLQTKRAQKYYQGVLKQNMRIIIQSRVWIISRCNKKKIYINNYLFNHKHKWFKRINMWDSKHYLVLYQFCFKQIMV